MALESPRSRRLTVLSTFPIAFVNNVGNWRGLENCQSHNGASLLNRQKIVRIADSAGAVLLQEVPVAQDLLTLLVGLLTRRADAASLLLPKTSVVHTMFMRHPIDIIFLNEDSRCLAIYRSVGPWRVVAGPRGTVSTLETKSREPSVFIGTRVGDYLSLEPET
jgi:uncharacterized membrane protein (UPF0127 family)